MEPINFTDDELMIRLDQLAKECKLLQIYLVDVNDDYLKTKMAQLKFEFARHRYFQLLREVKSRGLKITEEGRRITELLFN